MSEKPKSSCKLKEEPSSLVHVVQLKFVLETPCPEIPSSLLIKTVPSTQAEKGSNSSRVSAVSDSAVNKRGTVAHPLLVCKWSIYPCFDHGTQGLGTGWKGTQMERKMDRSILKDTIFQSRLRHLSKACSSSNSCYLGRALLHIMYSQALHWGPGPSHRMLRISRIPSVLYIFTRTRPLALGIPNPACGSGVSDSQLYLDT